MSNLTHPIKTLGMLRLASSRLLFSQARVVSGAFTINRHNLLTTTSISELAQSQSRVLNDKFVKILESRIRSNQLSSRLNNKEMPPADFPFTIHHDRGYITLKNELGGEMIEVDVMLSQSNLPYTQLTVNIIKEDGRELEITAFASSDNIEISNIAIWGPVTPTTQIWYSVDEDLEAALLEFLEIRGIKKSYSRFLCGLCIRQEIQDRITHMKDIKDFIME